MTQDTKHFIVQLVLRLVLFCIWFLFVTFAITSGCFALAHLVVQNDQLRDLVRHSTFWRTVLAMSIGIIWILLLIYLGFLLPRMILTRRARHEKPAA